MENREFEEISLLDYLNVLVKQRRMIVRNTLLAGLMTALISFFLPKYYTASTTLLPPDENEQPGLRSLLATAPGGLLDLAGVSGGSSKIFEEILKSRTVADGVLATKYDTDGQVKDLYERWDVSLKADGVRKLHKHTQISSGEEGIIRIDVELRDPHLAAAVAKQYVAELERVNQDKSLSKAKSSRLYIEQQLKLTENNLKKAGNALASFQSDFKAVNLEEQTKVAIEKAGEIKGTIMAKEVELEVAKQTMKRDNPFVLRLQKELDELRKQFEHIQFGNSVPFKEQRDYFIPFANVPEVGLQYADLIREVKVQETVWQLLNQQYYSAKIQEARDTPTVQVLDEAVPAEKKSRPKRTLLVLIASIVGCSISVLAAFVVEFLAHVEKNESEFKKVKEMAGEFKKDLQLLRTWLGKMLGRS